MPRSAWRKWFVLAAVLVLATGTGLPHAAFAKDGGGGGGGGGSSSGNGGDGGGDHGGGGGNGSSGENHGGGGNGNGGGGGGNQDGGNNGNGGGGNDGNGGNGDGGEGGSGRRNKGSQGQWDQSGSNEARNAVSHGLALPLGRVLPVVNGAVSGKVLDVDLQQFPTGRWFYKFLVLTRNGAYSEVLVDALRNRIIRVRKR